MQHAALAQRFDEIGRGLEADGHRIIVRKARALIEGGDLDGALRFLEEAGRRLPGDPLAGLAEAVGRWREAGGDVDALVGEAGWQAARAREDHLSALIASATASDDEGGVSLDALAARLAEQSKALADAEPLPPIDIPAVVEQPSAPDATRPVEEAPSQLEARPMDLEDQPVEPPAVEDAPDDEAPAIDAAPADEAPADAAPQIDDAPTVDEVPAIDEAPAADDASADAALSAADEAAPAEVPVETPPVIEVTPAETGSSSGMVIMLLLLAAALGAAWYFTR